MNKKLVEAIKDFRYLLNRGYRRESAQTFVANHFKLGAEERHLLARCVFSSEEAKDQKNKLVGMKKVKGKWLAIDGYNVLITVETILKGEPVVRCDDRIIRDLRGVFGKYRICEVTFEAVDEIIMAVGRAKPRKVTVLFDSQVSRSGELAQFVERKMLLSGIEAEAWAERNVDSKVAEAEVVSSSDRVVVRKAKRIWDIPAHILRRRGGKVLDVSSI